MYLFHLHNHVGVSVITDLKLTPLFLLLGADTVSCWQGNNVQFHSPGGFKNKTQWCLSFMKTEIHYFSLFSFFLALHSSQPCIIYLISEPESVGLLKNRYQGTKPAMHSVTGPFDRRVHLEVRHINRKGNFLGSWKH